MLTRLLHILIAIALLIVGHHIQAPCVSDFAQALNCCLALWARNLSLDNGLDRLIRKEGLFDIV